MIKVAPEITIKDSRAALARRLTFLLFFSSGVSGLAYEVAWSRQLTYLFGATLFAVATVLSSFMGGLALGSYLFGKWSDQRGNNLKLFGLLQIGIGLSALSLPFFFSLLDPLYRILYQRFETGFFILSLLRFVFTFLVLLIPTTLMGGTLPALSRFMVKENRTLGLNVGALYSVNTLGAVLGCFLTGFVLIAFLGLKGSIALAVAINIFVGIASLWLSSSIPSEISETDSAEAAEPSAAAPVADREEAGSSRKIVHAALWCYAISGFIALSYQVVWNRALVFTFDVMKNTTYSFTAMLTVFLIGLSAGGMVMSVFVDRQKDPLRLFGLIELLIGLFGAFSFFAIFHLGPWIAPFDLDQKVATLNWGAGVMNVFAKTSAAIFMPTFLMGMAFPVVTKICVDRIRHVGFGVGRLYSVNTLGAIVGAFASGFILIPLLGIAGTIFVLSVGNILIALFLFWINPTLSKGSRSTLSAICLLSVLTLLVRIPRNAQFQEISPTERMIFYKEGPLATVSVVENSFKYRTLYVDNVGVAGTDRIILTDQKSLAHIPMLLLKDPKSALTVGFGSGGASYSYTRFSSIDEIHCVEICDTVMDSAPDLLASNHGILLPIDRKAMAPRPLRDYVSEAYRGYLTFDPRYKIIIDDVRSYLRFTGRKYDVIATDCTDLRYKSNANLYDYEYFRLCRDRITEEGMVVVWMPLGGLSDDMFRVALRTFYKVFPQMSVWYMNNESTHYIILIGTPRPLRIDYDLMREKLEEKTVREDLAELFLDDADKILSCFLCDQGELEAFLKGDKINSENRPYLEFESPKYGYGEQPMIDNLNALMGLRSSITTYLFNVSNAEEVKARIAKYEEALPHIVKGHEHYRSLRILESCRSYMEALRICPEDKATRYLLDFEELKLRIAANPRDAWGYRELGAAYFEQKRYSEAVTILNAFLEKAALSEDASQSARDYYRESLIYANKTIGRSYIEVGNPKYAMPYLKRAMELNPDDAEIPGLMKKASQ